MDDVFGQHRFRVRMAWGPTGAKVAVRRGDIAVVIDVLSFSTSLNVATDRGTTVYPYVFGQDAAADFARRQEATLAMDRRRASGPHDVSLSPASILAAEPMERLVLPSPNGSTISFGMIDVGALVIGGCLRNRKAVASWIQTELARDHARAVTLIPAGEQWPGGALRPAAEDLWGAGAVLAALDDAIGSFSPEARSAAGAFAAVEQSLEAALLDCISGRDLATRGFEDDVRIAAELDGSGGVPILARDSFIAAAPS